MGRRKKEKGKLVVISGFSGAAAFRYSELWDALDTSEAGVPMQILWHPDKYLDEFLGI